MFGFHFRRSLFVATVSIFGWSSASAEVGLIDAAKRGDEAAVSALLKGGADARAQENDGQTALHWAAYYENVTMADQLIRAGANVNAANVYGVTPLFLACENGSSAIVERLLAAGANPAAALPSGETPLMTAARTGNVDAVKLLLARHVEIDDREKEKGQTALMWAAADGQPAVVKVLLEAGADLHARTKAGFTALLFAARNGDVESAKALLAGGADVNEKGPDGGSILLMASASGNEPMVKFLLEKDANPNAADKSGMTPLHAAIWLQRGRVDMIKELLAYGANPNARLTGIPPRTPTEFGANYTYLIGGSPFILAAKSGDVPVMQALVAGGADPQLRTDDDTTALMASSGISWIIGVSDSTFETAMDSAKYLLGLGIDVNAVNKAGQTALYGAARNGIDPLVQYLVDKGANVNVTDKRGITPLYAAGHAQLSASLIEQKTTMELLRKLGATK